MKDMNQVPCRAGETQNHLFLPDSKPLNMQRRELTLRAFRKHVFVERATIVP